MPLDIFEFAIIKNMITIIIAGGSGTRLWPLSTPDYPKHLLSLTGRRSLLRYTFERAKTLSDKICVLTDASHAKHVQNQLPELNKNCFIIELGRRGTANCIVAALSHVSQRFDSGEPIAFLAADHYVRDTAGFTLSFKVAGKAAKETNRIVLIGVEPTYPATGFGYIQKDGTFDEKSLMYNVDSFKEKPDYKTARQYVATGDYLWNCGYFVGTLEAFLASMKKHATKLYKNYEALNKTPNQADFNKVYLGFESESIDYALMEKVNNLLVVPAGFDWMDLGSFSDLHKAVESDEQGNHRKGKNIEIDDVENSFIQNYEDKAIAVVGLDNVVIVNTKNGLLIARKDNVQKIGEVSKRFQN